MASATALRQLGSHDKPFKYVFVSGMGADQREQGGWFQALFAKVKGRAERELVAMENEGGDIKVVNLRPGGIIPTEEVSREWCRRQAQLLEPADCVQ